MEEEMKRLIGILVMLAMLFPVFAWAADDAMTVDEETVVVRIDGADRKVTILTFDILSDAADGSLTNPTLTVGRGSFAVTKPYTGTIIWAEIKPDGGATAPDANYDVALIDNSDTTIDFLGGLFDNCSQTLTRAAVPVDEVNGGPITLINRTLDIYGGSDTSGNSGMGNANGCVLKVWIAQ